LKKYWLALGLAALGAYLLWAWWSDSTHAPLTLYVAPNSVSASDSWLWIFDNDCRDERHPCLTVQAAVQQIPERVRHQVVIRSPPEVGHAEEPPIQPRSAGDGGPPCKAVETHYGDGTVGLECQQ